MKKWMSLLITLCMALSLLTVTALAAEGDVEINNTNFPDAKFREKVAEFDTNQDGVLSAAEIDQVTVIDCGGTRTESGGISDLTGIAYFTSLQQLDCTSNQISKLDLSHNTALTKLDCANNQLTELNVSNNAALKTLFCGGNRLTELDVSHNTALETLYCTSNQLTRLDVSHNPALTNLSCGGNDGNQLTELDVSKNTQLRSLNFINNQITSIDLSHNPALQRLLCYHNQLTALDVSHNPELSSLLCGQNRLTALDVSSNPVLGTLWCYYNRLTALDVSRNPELQGLLCYGNRLTTLDVSKNTKLREFKCGSNYLTSLDISGLTSLTMFASPDNKYSITARADRTFDLSRLPGSFDVSKASNWKGGAVNGSILTVNADTNKVTYTYDCGNGKSETFTLNVTVDAPAHTHTYGDWSKDATNHWHECTDPSCPDKTGSVNDKAAHIYDNAADTSCNVCGYTRTVAPSHTHTYGDWSKDATNHWHECTDPACPDKAGSVNDKAAHTFTWKADRETIKAKTWFKHKECTVCGYKRSAGTAINKAPGNNNTLTSPKTGDSTNLALYSFILAMSACMLVGAAGIDARKKQRR